MSAHVCVNGTVLEWCSTKRYIRQKGIIAAAPQSVEKPGETVIDTGLYLASRPLRLLGNGKPGDAVRWKRAVSCVNSSEREKQRQTQGQTPATPLDQRARAARYAGAVASRPRG